MPTSELPFDDEHAALYGVGQVAEMLGVQPAFLRRLDTEHIVNPSRSAGGQRRYSRAEIGTVHKVIELTREGCTLAGVRRIIELEAQLRAVTIELDAERRRHGHPEELGRSER